MFFWSKGRKLPGPHVFRASRFSRGNLLYPTQVAVTPGSVVHYTPALIGGQEHSMHIAHVASVLIDRKLFFSNVLIESSGGTSPVRCHGHRKADAVEMKRLIEQFQSEYYRGAAARPWRRRRLTSARPRSTWRRLPFLSAGPSLGNRGALPGAGAVAAARRAAALPLRPAGRERSTSKR